MATKSQKARAAKVAAFKTALDGKLAQDASVDELVKSLLAADEAEEKEDDKAKDMKAKDRKGRDSMEDLKEKLKGKMSAEDWKAACDDIDGMSAEDEEEDEDDKAKDEEKDMVTKKAMDAAIKLAQDSAAKNAETATMKRLQDIRAAERAVAPLIGEVVLGLDSAAAIYRAALKASDVDTTGVDPSAFPAMVALLSRQKTTTNTRTEIAVDSSELASFKKRIGDERSIRVLG